MVDIHLMKSSELDRTFSKFEVSGDNLVKRPVKRPLFKPTVGRNGRIYINDIQYFSNIAKELWEFEVCGYHVLKKWLLVRKKRRLTPGEILHYIKICRALQLTVKYREEIDGLYTRTPPHYSIIPSPQLIVSEANYVLDLLTRGHREKK